MTEYFIQIKWVQALDDGGWAWEIREKGKSLVVANGFAYFRWTAKLIAERAARRHAKGLPWYKDPNLGYEYTVWDR